MSGVPEIVAALDRFDERIAAVGSRRFSAMLGPSASTEWGTPEWLFGAIATRYGPFDLDAAASAENTKCHRYFDMQANGLERQWMGRVWLNPPYGRQMADWLDKAYRESLTGTHVTCLIPARTGARWWTDMVKPRATVIEYLTERVKFVGAPHNAPFDCAVVCYFPEIRRVRP